ncbi:MAG: hypothetical protein FWG11_06130, partial [Promicromonosporaceae bacterium]|nr:hypothetical protein [Promicromonosporaceae bacterium]
SRAELLEAGVLYLDGLGFNGNLLVHAVQDPDRVDLGRARLAGAGGAERVLSSVRQQISGAPAHVHTAVLSCELYSQGLQRDSELSRLRGLLSPVTDEFQIACYLRGQVEYATSFYSSLLRSGQTTSFAAFLDGCRPGRSTFDHLATVNRWARIFGDDAMALRVYERPSLVGGDIVTDFADLLGVSPSVLQGSSPSASVNESLAPAGQALLRGLNTLPATGRRPSDGTNSPLRRQCLQVIEERFSGQPGNQPSERQAREIERRFAVDNEVLRAKWFPERPAMFVDYSPRPVSLEFGEDFQAALAEILRLVHTVPGRWRSLSLRRLAGYPQWLLRRRRR